MSAEAGIPFFRHTTVGRPNGEAFEAWRQLMAPTYDIAPVEPSRRLPDGHAIVYQLGGILAHRMVFATQQVRRTRKQAANAADNITLQYWRSGDYHGMIAGQRLAILPGTAALIGSRRLVEGVATRTDTCGIVVPRALFHGLPIEAFGACLDPARNRLLVARLAALYREMPETRASAIPQLRHELTAFLRRLFDPSLAADLLEGKDLDGGLRPMARTIIRENLGRPDLGPEMIAERLRVSRATLYRLFAPEEGVMRVVQRERLHAVRDALADPLEARSLGHLASAFALGSPAQLSRGFRDRFGASPREWRDEHRRALEAQGETDLTLLWAWLRQHD